MEINKYIYIYIYVGLIKSIMNNILLLDIFSLTAPSIADKCFVLNVPTLKMFTIQSKVPFPSAEQNSLHWESGFKCQWS